MSYSDYNSRKNNLALDSLGNITAETIGNKIMKISSNVTQIEQAARNLGTNKDNEALRDKLNNLISSTRELGKDAADDLKTFTKTGGDKKSQQKLTKDLQTWLQKFQEVHRMAADKEQNTPLPQKSNFNSESSSRGGGGAGFGRQKPSSSNKNNYAYEEDDEENDKEQKSLMEDSRKQGQFFKQQEVEFQHAVIMDRDQDITQIAKTVSEVNEIFRDLSELVSTQGEMIDSIESNIETSVVRTNEGVVEITKASKYQKSSRNKLCCLALIILVIVGVLFVIIWFFGIKKTF